MMEELISRSQVMLDLADRVALVSCPENLDENGFLREPLSYDLNAEIEGVLRPDDVANRARRSYFSGYRSSESEPSFGSDIREVIREAHRMRSENFIAKPEDGGWVWSLERLADMTFRATMSRLSRDSVNVPLMGAVRVVRDGFPKDMGVITIVARTAELALLEAVLRARAAEAEFKEKMA